MTKRVVLIAGPTASGKSALALEKAQALAGIIVNADSMQVYDVLDALTARPSAADRHAVPHHLYGFVPPSERFSTGHWLTAVDRLLRQDEFKRRPIIFAGGTGLYFQALTKGFTPTPHVPDEIVARLNQEIGALDRAGRQALLASRDPLAAEQITEPDPQRVVRALSIKEATGKSLVEWQAEPTGGLLPDEGVERIVINPARDVLRQRIADRFEHMFQSGAVAEVEALRALDLDPSLPAMKAIGVPQISDWLDGAISQEEAVERAVIATRQYAKRQRTWFRKQMANWHWIE